METDWTSKLQTPQSRDNLGWLAQLSSLPLLLKGIIRPEDALLAHQHGVAGLSFLTTGVKASPMPCRRPLIVDVTQGRLEVFVDGGIRCGADVLRALTLGAQAVLVAGPTLWGLTVGGADGVQRVLTALRDELETVMAITGASRISEIDRSVLA